ncbi:MAG: hypothetical protein QNJ97_04465 [Myxococcota bacterium]|nr:hypothetical protein [Myxococcota bacterium]
MLRQHIFICGFLICSAACAPPKVNMARGTRAFEPEDYRAVFTNWSREFHIIPVDGIENVLTARATYLGYEFRWAYVVRTAHDFRLSPAERYQLHEKEFGVLDKQHTFFITVMSGIKKSDDLSSETDQWQIRLEDDRGRQVAPTEIEEIRKPSITETTYFDFDPVHRTAYRITFPLLASDGAPILTPSATFFSLIFSSALGQGTMRWETTATP